jgi:Cupin-like domain
VTVCVPDSDRLPIDVSTYSAAVSPAIQVLDAVRTDYFKDPEHRRRPVIFEGACRDWPALTSWSIEALAKHMGDTVLPVRDVPGGRPDCRLRKGAGYRANMMKASEYFDRLSANDLGSLYLSLIRVNDVFPELAKDIGTLNCIPDPGDTTPLLWIGGQGTFTALHYDIWDNFHVLLSGRKRFRLYDRRDFVRMYPNSMFSRCAHVSQVDPDAPDRRRFPRFPTEGIDVVLRPGQTLWLPKEWWHAVWTEEPSVALSYWVGQAHRVSRSRLHLMFVGVLDGLFRKFEGALGHPDAAA